MYWKHKGYDYLAYKSICNLENKENIISITRYDNELVKLSFDDHSEEKFIVFDWEYIDKISDCMSEFKNLERLNFDESYAIKRLEHLDLPRLKVLKFYKSGISKLENLDKLPSLITLRIGNSKIEKLEGLDNLKNLKYLELSDNKIKKMEGFDNLRELNRLFLSKNDIKEIDGVNNLKKLEMLFLSNNGISKIENLNELKDLKELDLRNNDISKLSGLDSLNALKKLYLSGNKIVELPEINSTIENLEHLSLYNGKRDYPNDGGEFCPKSTIGNWELSVCNIKNKRIFGKREFKWEHVHNELIHEWMDEWNESVEAFND